MPGFRESVRSCAYEKYSQFSGRTGRAEFWWFILALFLINCTLIVIGIILPFIQTSILGGFTLIHQFCRIGDHAMTGFGAKISQDISPFVMASGTPTTAYGINAEGLRRRGFSPDQITGIKRAYKTVYRSGLTLEEAKMKLLEEAAASPESAKYIEQMHTFISEAQRGLLR